MSEDCQLFICGSSFSVAHKEIKLKQLLEKSAMLSVITWHGHRMQVVKTKNSKFLQEEPTCSPYSSFFLVLISAHGKKLHCHLDYLHPLENPIKILQKFVESEIKIMNNIVEGLTFTLRGREFL